MISNKTKSTLKTVKTISKVTVGDKPLSFTTGVINAMVTVLLYEYASSTVRRLNKINTKRLTRLANLTADIIDAAREVYGSVQNVIANDERFNRILSLIELIRTANENETTIGYSIINARDEVTTWLYTHSFKSNEDLQKLEFWSKGLLYQVTKNIKVLFDSAEVEYDDRLNKALVNYSK